MGEFDLSLIREFRNCPAFYNRNSPHFRDKIFTAHEWQEISNKLGYDVSLLKDRMLQLRNRYNLEKRRLEQLREENPGKNVESPWPLYNQLHFLSDHIRARRSYKRMLPLQSTTATTTAELSNSCSNPSSLGGAACHAAAPFANGLLTVKMEDNARDDETETQSGTDTATVFAPPPSQKQVYSAANNHEHSMNVADKDIPVQLPASLPASITIRRLDTMRDNSTQRPPSKRPHLTKLAQVDSRQTNDNCGLQHHSDAKMICVNAREQKYESFGNFMSASLFELPPKQALQLVEKFTSELVEVLIQKNEISDAPNDNLNG